MLCLDSTALFYKVTWQHFCLKVGMIHTGQEVGGCRERGGGRSQSMRSPVGQDPLLQLVLARGSGLSPHRGMRGHVAVAGGGSLWALCSGHFCFLVLTRG